MQFEFLKSLFGHAQPGGVERARQAESAPLPAAASPEPIPRKRIPLPDLKPLVETARELLRAAGAPALAERMVVRWNPRLRNTAGMAYPMKALITLNPRLVLFGEEELDRTLRHELAHLLAQDRVGRRRIEPHGAEWKQACCDIGLPGEKRTHDLPLPRERRQPRHFYRCGHCGFVLPRVQPLRRKSACLKCCRAHNRGNYDVRYAFVRIPPPKSAK